MRLPSTSPLVSVRRNVKTRSVAYEAMARKGDVDEDMEDQPEASTSTSGFTDLPCLSDSNFSTSYTWHSVGEEGRYSAASVGELDEEEERWILGIDEAGRGPVLGEPGRRLALVRLSAAEVMAQSAHPTMDCRPASLRLRVLPGQIQRRAQGSRLCRCVAAPLFLLRPGIEIWPKRADAQHVRKIADSKTLTDDKRRTLMDTILTGAARDNDLQYAVTVMHPQDISAGMLQRTNYSL